MKNSLDQGIQRHWHFVVGVAGTTIEPQVRRGGGQGGGGEGEGGGGGGVQQESNKGCQEKHYGGNTSDSSDNCRRFFTAPLSMQSTRIEEIGNCFE